MSGPPSPKRQRTEEKQAQDESTLDLSVVESIIEAANEIEAEIETKSKKLAQQIIELESKHNIANRPLYEKRSKKLAEIPGFWKQALSNHVLIAQDFSESDAKIIEYLTDLGVTFVDQNGGFKVELAFDENPFFGKTTLWKQILFTKDDEEPIVTCNEPKWKNSPEAKEAKESCSFISSFTEKDGDHDAVEIIKDEIWKSPVQFFLQEESEGEEGEEEGEEGEEEDEEEENE